MSADPEDYAMVREQNNHLWQSRLAAEPHLSTARMRHRLRRLGLQGEDSSGAWLDMVALLTRED